MEQKIDPADFLQRFSTKALWHFTGYKKTEEKSFEILSLILSGKLIKISEKPQMIKMPSGKERWGYPCSCMCDIPFKDLKIHIARYGRFGIAFRKLNAVTSGYFNPVLYAHKDHHLLKRAETVLEELEKLSSPHENLSKVLEEYLLLVGTYTKVANLLTRIHFDTDVDNDQKNNFYYEREWRSAYNWIFNIVDVAAIMMPEEYINIFRKKFAGEFDNVSVISSEMVEIL